MTEYVSGCLAVSPPLLLFLLVPSESSSLHAAPRHGAMIILYIYDAFIYPLLTHHPTAACATGKPSMLRRDQQTVLDY